MVKEVVVEDRIQVMFDFFDISKSGFIEKQDFIKMLYNYLKRDILRMLYKIETSRNLVGKPVTKRASIEFTTHRRVGLPSTKNIHEDLQSLNLEQMKLLSQNRLHSKQRLSSRKFRPQSTQFKYGKQYYTTMNHTIKFIADLVYKEHGEGEFQHQLSRKAFEVWVKGNAGILETFDKWLRKDVWTKDGGTGGLLYRTEPSVVGNYMKVNMRTAKDLLKLYKKNFVELFNELLFIYKDSSGRDLLRVVILTNLDIVFIDEQLKIKFQFPECELYKKVTLVLDSSEQYSKWKNSIKPFLKKTVDKFYRFSEKIGRGTFSTVNKGICRTNPDLKVAIKTIVKESLTPDEKSLIAEECIIMGKLDHVNIVKFIRKFEDTERLYYIFELVEGGDLYDHITKQGRICEEVARVVFRQLLNVVKYLHDRHILHRDLKPENIMIIFNEVTGFIESIKLIDFGFATYFSIDNLPSLSCGTLNYAAPEVLLGEKYGPPSDLFSVGVILYLM